MISRKSVITFGMVAIPIAMHTTKQDNDIHFNQLHKEDNSRIRYKKTCAHCGDPHRKGNAGLQRAQEAAGDTGAFILPRFAEGRPADRKGPTDFNDLHAIEGIDAVRVQIGELHRLLGVNS